jgi:hypothetical protein
VHTRRNLLQEGSSNLLVRGVLGQINGDQNLLSLLIDIANVNTTLVGEEDPVALWLTDELAYIKLNGFI